MALKKIGCRLPNGIVLDLNGKDVEIKGLNSSLIIGADYVTTDIDSSFWDEWLKINNNSDLIKNNILFEAKDEPSAKSKAKEVSAEKTGFEPIPQAINNIKPA